MLPPKEQAKVFFLYLLRSTAALSYSEHHVSKAAVAVTTAQSSRPISSSNSHDSSPSPLLEGHIALRLATRSDVPRIQRCNLATLPENYSNNFYCSHLRQWPDLALVAEHIPPGYEVEYNRKNSPTGDAAAGAKKKMHLLDSYDPNEKEFDIVGYVLGKVEEMPLASSFPPDTYSDTSSPSSFEMNSIQRRQHGRKDQEEEDEADLLRYLQWQQQNKNKTELLGHVTSLAVLEPFRRCGLAAQLMKQLHLHLQYQYNAKGVGLNVRIGNHAARKLYVDKLGYRVEDVLDAYYQDGEDAFFMRKDLPVDMTYEALYESARMKEVSSPKLTPESANNRSKPSSVLRRIVQPWWGTNANSNVRGTNTVTNVWEHGPEEYRLPRMIRLSQPHSGESKLFRLDSANAGSVTDSSASSSSRIAAADSMDLITTTSVSQKKVVANSM